MKRVNVEIWSDFACPWCWIAKRRFEKAVFRLAGEVDVIVTPKSYRLAKGAAPEDFKQAIIRKSVSITAAEKLLSMIEERGALEGLKYNFDTMRFGDTSDAHALVKSIASVADKNTAVERIFQAYTTDGIDIFNRDVLISLVKDLGISESEIDFDSPQIASEISQDELKANRLSNGVPLFIFNSGYPLSGAREVADFESALLRAAKDAPEFLDDVSGQSCGIDGCAV